MDGERVGQSRRLRGGNRLCIALVLLLGVGSATPLHAGVLSKAMPIVTGTYLHKEDLAFEAMAREGLQELEKAGPDVLVTEPENGRLRVEAGGRAETFTVAGVANGDDVVAVLQRACVFVEGAMDRPERPVPGGLESVALRGVLSTVDRHSQVIVGDSLDEFNTRFEGTLVGIGARVGQRAGALRVLKPFPGTPAARAGLLPMDEIVAIDGYPASALNTDDAVERIRGPAGVPVVLTVRRGGESGPRAFVIAREKVVAPSVESERLDGDVGLITIDHFSQETSQELGDHIEELRAGGPVDGIILDLRDNSGGSLIHSARVVNAFTPVGTLVRTEGRNGEQVEGLTPGVEARPERVIFEGPLVVLVNGRTASGSEIVAGGLKALERSLTIGTQTFGKGTVQKVFPLDASVSMKLTVARWLLPGDAYINLVGVTPDVVTGQLWLDRGQVALPDVFDEGVGYQGRADLGGALGPKRRAGSGRAPTIDGTQSAAVATLFYPRILSGWGEPLEAVPSAPDGEESPTEVAPPAPGASTLPGDAGESKWNDVELRLAWDVLQRATAADRRPALVEIASDLAVVTQKEQDQRLVAAAAKLNLKWTSGAVRWLDRRPSREETVVPKPLAPELSLETPELRAGESAILWLRARNPTRQPMTHLRAVVRSSSDALDDLGFIVGELQPGQEVRLGARVTPSRSQPTRLDGYRLYALDDRGQLGPPTLGTVVVRGLEPADLRVATTVVQGAAGEGGTDWAATVRVENVGAIGTGELRAWLGNAPPGPAVERLEKFRTMDSVAPGHHVEGELRIKVRGPPETAVVLPLYVRDQQTGATMEIALHLPPQASVGPLAPADVLVHSLPAEAPPAKGQGPWSLKGEVRAERGLSWVQVFVAGDKVWTLGSEGRKGLAQAAFDLQVPLFVGPNQVTVRTRTLEGVERSWAGWVYGEPATP